MLSKFRVLPLVGVVGLTFSLTAGCGGGGSTESIQNRGSDTLLQVAQAWSEAYEAASVEVSGGGSGVGINALIGGTVHVANASRAIKEGEIKKAKDKTGKEPVEFIVGYDALAIYVHKDNPLEEISVEQLSKIFGANESITTWDQLGVTIPGCDSKKIQIAGRQSGSGTYDYFRTATVGKEGKFHLNINEQNGSRALVAFIEKAPCAIGYSGMGYKTENVKFLKVKKGDGTAVLPSAATVHDKSYPIARPLFMYTLGQPEGAVKDYMNYVQSKPAQAVLEKLKYVPLPEDKMKK